MKKKRKILFTLVSLIALTVYVHHNLTYHSVYYASKMPHKEGTNPVLVMVEKNKRIITLPDSPYLELDHIGGLSGHDVLWNKKLGIRIVRFAGEIRVSKAKSIVIFDENTGSYVNGEIEDEQLREDVPFTDEQRQQFLSELDAFLSDIVEVQSAPFINLQWLFNYLHESAFNE